MDFAFIHSMRGTEPSEKGGIVLEFVYRRLRGCSDDYVDKALEARPDSKNSQKLRLDGRFEADRFGSFDGTVNVARSNPELERFPAKFH